MSQPSQSCCLTWCPASEACCYLPLGSQKGNSCGTQMTLGQPQLGLHLTRCGGGTSPLMLSQLGLVQVGDVLPLQLADCAAHQLKLLDVSANLSFTCNGSYCIHIISKSSTAVLQAKKQCLCKGSLHLTFCYVRQLTKLNAAHAHAQT